MVFVSMCESEEGGCAGMDIFTIEKLIFNTFYLRNLRNLVFRSRRILIRFFATNWRTPTDLGEFFDDC